MPHLCLSELIKTGVLTQKSEIVYYYRFYWNLYYYRCCYFCFGYLLPYCCCCSRSRLSEISQMFSLAFVLPHFKLHFYWTFSNFFHRSLIFFLKSIIQRTLCPIYGAIINAFFSSPSIRTCTSRSNDPVYFNEVMIFDLLNLDIVALEMQLAKIISTFLIHYLML